MRFRGSVLARADAAGYKGDCLQDAQGRVKKKKKKSMGVLGSSCAAHAVRSPTGFRWAKVQETRGDGDTLEAS